ncbi:tRNA pseudouridine synthase B [Talaromyces islandicus]|uniref:tRNA pseudouridine(55) synthase n=1 Tax=Talaromyces islandicus TaxID=28573 RepID=A0A0U1M546_TALIS|nr:tRNA pseudouridine synthase B [Talaromyces islandicus]
MVVQFCIDCGNLLDETPQDHVTCELCGKVAKNQMFSHVQTSVSKGFPSKLRTKLTSYTQKVTAETLGSGPTIKMECPECPSNEVTWTEAQLRSADEGSTIFYRCVKCGHRNIEVGGIELCAPKDSLSVDELSRPGHQYRRKAIWNKNVQRQGLRGASRYFSCIYTYTGEEKLTSESIQAIHKPEGITSAGVLRDLQTHFNPSATFQPWIEREQERRSNDNNYQRNKHRRRYRKRPEVKIGHGGTLDPMATGVLITGIGQGTKHLHTFLGCTKTYETVVTFGVASDTYDCTGKTVRRAAYEHITRTMVEEALAKFRGKIMQRPPIFSAKRIDGKRLYEYAREGIEPPVEIKSVPVEVFDLELLEWYEPGSHEYKWPQEEMSGPERVLAEKLLDKDAAIPVASDAEAEAVEAQAAATKSPSSKRKASPLPEKSEVADEQGSISATKRVKTDGEELQSTTTTTTITTTTEADSLQTSKAVPGEEKEEAKEVQKTEMPVPGPAAARIRMTVSGGFYVRSLAHDLGKAVGSYGIMCSLVRTRQGDYTLDADKVINYSELEAGEEVWGPKVKQLLSEWQEKNQTE